jgi:hypothetical protein
MTELVRKDVSATNGGELSTGAQTVAGNKTWSGTQTFQNTASFQQPISGFVAGNDTRNLIINGNFDFWQRGTTFTRTAQPAFSGYVGADRWFHNQGGGTTSYTIDRQADVPTVAQSGFQSVYSMRYLNSASTGTWLALGYAVEGQDYQAIHARPFRLQFWVKSSVAGTYGINFSNNAETRAYSTTYTISSPSTWQKITLDITADSSGTWAFDNTKGLQIWWVLNNGTSATTATTNNVWESTGARQPNGSFAAFGTTVGATFNIAQVSIIPGSFASTVSIPFSRAGCTISDEKRMCQRYVLMIDMAGSEVFGFGQLHTGTTYRFLVPTPTTMRAGPITFTTAGSFSLTGTSSTTAASFAYVDRLENGVQVSCVAGVAVGQVGIVATVGAATFLMESEL